MELKIGTKQLLLVLQILSWIIFIGLCIENGGIIFNTIYALFNPVVAQHFWNRTDLSELYAHDKGMFVVMGSLMAITASIKSLIFYLIVKIFYDKRFDMSRPFHPELSKLITKITYCCLGTGLFSYWAAKHVIWFQEKGITMPDIDRLRIGGADVWLFMAVVLFVIGQVFKKGLELQSENDLTV